MDYLAHAMNLAARGFRVFPLHPNSKLPLIEAYSEVASANPVKIRSFWTDPVLEITHEYNVGISTQSFGSLARVGALVVIDIDNRDGKDGDSEIFKLELQGLEFPPTFTQTTPTGGKHLIYSHPVPLSGGTNKIAPGVDVKSAGGYVVGAGSTIDGVAYVISDDRPIAPLPEWVAYRLREAPLKSGAKVEPLGDVNVDEATRRAIHYLEKEAPISIEGEGGDSTAYRVAAQIKDFGLTPALCLDLMLEHWNKKCEPGWSADELQTKIDHAFRYGVEPPGVAAAELQFSKVETESDEGPTLHPFEVLNQEYAFVVAGGGSHILWETTGPSGEFRLEHLAIPAFHQMHAAKVITIGDKTKPVTQFWMNSARRRSYDGICFMPGRQAPKRFYNLWRGFSVEPAKPTDRFSKKATDSLQMFLAHALENVCHGDKSLCEWLIGYFAQLVQKPSEKPLTALVFRGSKGVGKNALIERIGALVSNHYMLTSDQRYLLGNFNGFLENNLLFVLDEAVWAGEKRAEGVLKNLITGKHHVIEHKGKEPYTVDNCTRVVIIGNEEWLVPASQDERRFAVFNVGEGRKQDRDFFQRLREGMEAGGYSLLLRYLLDFDLSKIDVNLAPSTTGLMEQKLNSLHPIHQWWSDCLTEGHLVGYEFDSGDWITQVEKDMLRDAFKKYLRGRNIGGWSQSTVGFGKVLKACVPKLSEARKRDDGRITRVYELPELSEARLMWERYIGHKQNWDH